MSAPSKNSLTTALTVVSALAVLTLLVAGAIHNSEQGAVKGGASDALRGVRHLSDIDPVSVVMKPNVNFPEQAMLAESGQLPLFNPDEKDS